MAALSLEALTVLMLLSLVVTLNLAPSSRLSSHFFSGSTVTSGSMALEHPFTPDQSAEDHGKRAVDSVAILQPARPLGMRHRHRSSRILKSRTIKAIPITSLSKGRVV